MIGQTISHYKILDKLGEGGMGVVYKALDTKLNRAVALKFLPPHVSGSDQDKTRFLQEAQAAASLSHPNICTIHGIEEHGGKQFIVMEFVEGQTLQEKKQNLPLKQALEIGIQIAEGLAAAHEKGIVHRDIKPENIIIRKDGIAQIMDFGLAKLRGASRLTKEGSTVGTAGYMSPEQVQGQEIDHRSDIFSFGVLLFEMLTGQLPFKGVHETAIAYEIVNVDSPPISSIKPDISPELDAIVLECLEKDPNERTQSAKQVAVELKRFKRESSKARLSRTMPARSMGVSQNQSRVHASNGVMVWGSLLIALFAGVGIGRFLFSPPSQPPPMVTRFLVPYENRDPLVEDGFGGGAISPDGSQLVYASARGGELYVRNLNENHARAIPGITGVVGRDVFYSPDGRWIAFFTRGKLMKQSVGGGTPAAICDVSDVWSGSWSEGGEIVLMQEWGSHLWIVSAGAGSVPRPLTKLKTEDGERAHLLPHALPGGKAALFTIWTGASFEESLIAAVDLFSGDHRVVLKGGSDARYVESGHLVYARGSTIMAIPFDLGTLKTVGESVPVTENVFLDGTSGKSGFSVSSNGTAVFVTGGLEYNPTVLTLVDPSGKKKQISPNKASIGNPVFSPDGRKLCVTIYGPTYNVGVYDLQRDILTPLTFTADNYRVAWLQDGSRISFSSNRGGMYQIFTISSDGGGAPEQLFEQKGNPYPSSWSRDGSYLAYVATGENTNSDIWLFTSNGNPKTRPFIQTRANESVPVISPDARWIAYVSDATGENEVYVQSFPDGKGKWRVSNGKGSLPRWSPDGRRVFFMRTNEIYSVPLAFQEGRTGTSIVIGREEKVFSATGLNIYDVSPKGTSIVTDQRIAGIQRRELNVVLNWYSELRAKVAGE